MGLRLPQRIIITRTINYAGFRMRALFDEDQRICSRCRCIIWHSGSDMIFYEIVDGAVRRALCSWCVPEGCMRQDGALGEIP